MALKDIFTKKPADDDEKVSEPPHGDVSAIVTEAAETKAAPEKDVAVAVAPEYRKPTKEEIKGIVARLRHRGFTNPMYNDPAQAFEKANPGWKTIWEYSPPDSKDQHEVMVRASLGYRLVKEHEIPAGFTLPHTTKDGPVRVADMVLMAAPEELHNAIYAEAAKIAYEDSNLPLEEYKRSLEEKGTTPGVKGQALGDVQFASESIQVDLGKLSGGAEAKE